MSVDKVFVFNSDRPQAQGNFTYQLLHSWRPGSMDTSLIASDNINNPRTMNAVYAVAARAGRSRPASRRLQTTENSASIRRRARGPLSPTACILLTA